MPLVHAQIIPSLSGFGDFESVTGGDRVQNFTDHHEPGAKTPTKVSFTGNFTDLVITRAYTPGRDNLLVEWWKQSLSGIDTKPRQLTKKYLNTLGAVVQTETFIVKVKDVKTPDGKAGDNTVGDVTVTLVCEGTL